jgi:hypothetical protein
MPTQTLTTNLRCNACVESIRPLLDAEPGVTDWSADVSGPQKTLTVSGEVGRDRVAELLRQKGYAVTGAVEPTPVPSPASSPTADEPPVSYFPLVLILIYVLLAVGAFEVAAGAWDGMRAMNHFMAGFFLVFSFFKLLDVPNFASSFRMYDWVAEKVPVYGTVYPFVELALGLAYLANVAPLATNAVTLVVMLAGAAGVARSMMQKRKVRCACLGAVFNLPMSSVTLFEDVLMAAMAAVMLAWLLTTGM